MGIPLPGARYEEIKRIIVNLFVRYGVSCVPVNGFELAAKMGIAVVPYAAISQSKRGLLIKESKDGFCVQRNTGEWFIYYNDRQNYRRINNTIFHEIGHIVLDHSEDSELAEKEVNFFAKYALVPPVLIHKLKLDDPVEIANFFDVSYEAGRYAYAYYQKWLTHGARDYTDYEITLLNLFQSVA